ncbi:MAG: hypothetical protein V7776_20945 [Halopseudomonas aestusnigri]
MDRRPKGKMMSDLGEQKFHLLIYIFPGTNTPVFHLCADLQAALLSANNIIPELWKLTGEVFTKEMGFIFLEDIQRIGYEF